MSLESFRLIGLLPLLVLFAALEAWLAKRWRRAGLDVRESAASLAIALGQKLSGAAGAGVTAALFATAWQHRVFTVPLDMWWGVALLFLGSELCYYWEHRASHEVRWFWASHSVHHSSNHFNLSAAYRLGWTAGLTGATAFFLPLVLLGFHPLGVALALAINLVYQFWLHTELVPKLGAFEWIFNSPSHHRVHHASNAQYLDRNYGGVLIVFDRFFGTFAAERADVPCRYGLVRPLLSYNPFVIVFHEWIAMARDIRRSRSLREVVRNVVGRPGAGWAAFPPKPPLTIDDKASSASARPRQASAIAAARALAFATPTTLTPMQGDTMPSRSLQLTVAVALFVTSGAMAFAQTTPDASSMARMQQMRAKMAERFAAADADHDGKLTRDEAKSKMPMVSKEFDAIDKSHKGYVTLDDIHAFARERMQQHAQSAHASASASK